jgi:hypothetical protein
MTKYRPSRRFVWMGVGAWGLAAVAGWVATAWLPAIFAMGVFLACSMMLVFLGLTPPIELREQSLTVGSRAIPWAEIRRVDHTGRRFPLLVSLTLDDGSHLRVVYAGNLDSAHSLLRNIRRSARLALIDGRPYREFWGEALPAAPEPRRLPAPSYRLLRPEDEAEVERLYQRLKTVGRLDARSSTDET